MLNCRRSVGVEESSLFKQEKVSRKLQKLPSRSTLGYKNAVIKPKASQNCVLVIVLRGLQIKKSTIVKRYKKRRIKQ